MGWVRPLQPQSWGVELEGTDVNSQTHLRRSSKRPLPSAALQRRPAKRARSSAQNEPENSQERHPHAKFAYTMDEFRMVMYHLVQLLQSVCTKMKLSHKIMATAVVYFRRFFIEASFFQFDPRVVVPTALYLATKVEEYGQIKVEMILEKMKWAVQRDTFKLKGEFLSVTPQDVLDCEVYMLQRLGFDMIVYHPELYLDDYLKRVAQAQTAGEGAKEVIRCIAQTAWNVLNDSYRSDVCLMFPPHLIALAAIHVSAVTQNRDARIWLDTLEVDFDEVAQVSKHLLDMYANHGTFFDVDLQTSGVSKLNALHACTYK